MDGSQDRAGRDDIVVKPVASLWNIVVPIVPNSAKSGSID